MSYNCEIKEMPARPTLSIRTTTGVQDLPQVLGVSYGAIAQYLGELGEYPAGAPYTAYFNMDTQNLDVEIGFPVSKKLSDKGEIKAGEMPAGNYAACTFVGPYNKIEPAYSALTEWVEQNGYEPTGVAYEIYLNDPTETPPEELQTEIVFPLK